MKKMNWKYLSVIAALSGLAAASIGICQNTPGVFYTAVSEDLGVLRGTFAFHATFSQLALALTSLFIPKIMRRFSFKQMIIIGSTLMILSTIGMSFSASLILFYVLAVLRGIGAALVANVPITILINRWFHKSNGTITSIALAFSGIAGAVCSPFLASCIQSFGWQKAYLLQALMILIFTLPALLIHFHNTPQEDGLLPYGADSNGPAPSTSSSASIPFHFVSIAFFALAIFTLMHTSITGISQHLSGMAVTAGLSAETGSFLLSIAMVGNILTKLLIGVLSDRIGPVKASLAMILVNLCSMFLLYCGFTSCTLWLIMLGSFLFGSVYSVGAVGIALITKHLFGRDSFSKIYPKISFMISLGSSLSLPLIGYIYDFTGSYMYAIIAAMVIDVVDICLLFLCVHNAKKSILAK